LLRRWSDAALILICSGQSLLFWQSSGPCFLGQTAR
jgi:hypothetical protein